MLAISVNARDCAWPMVTAVLMYDIRVLQSNHRGLCLNNSREDEAPDGLFTLMLQHDQYLMVTDYRDCVLGSERCQNEGLMLLSLC